jgi:hypothetical protein
MNIIWIFGGLLALWDATMCWLVYWRGPFKQTYNPLVGWVIRKAGMGAMTLGSTCYLDLPTSQLTPAGIIHETYHYEEQWKQWPLTFLPRYLIENLRKGYKCNGFEEAARKAAGQASECVNPTPWAVTA